MLTFLIYVGYQPNLSATNTVDVPRVNLPSNAQGMPTPEALGIVLRHAERLLSSHAVSALSVIFLGSLLSLLFPVDFIVYGRDTYAHSRNCPSHHFVTLNYLLV